MLSPRRSSYITPSRPDTTWGTRGWLTPARRGGSCHWRQEGRDGEEEAEEEEWESWPSSPHASLKGPMRLVARSHQSCGNHGRQTDVERCAAEGGTVTVAGQYRSFVAKEVASCVVRLALCPPLWRWFFFFPLNFSHRQSSGSSISIFFTQQRRPSLVYVAPRLHRQRWKESVF